MHKLLKEYQLIRKNLELRKVFIIHFEDANTLMDAKKFNKATAFYA